MRAGGSTALLDRVGGAGVVGVGVRLGGVGVDNLDVLDVHAEGSSRVVGLATGPLNGALAVGGVTASPDTDADIHGGLGEASAALGIVVVQGADDVAVDGPLDGLLLPVHLISVEFTLGVGHGGPGITVIGRGITLAEVVGLNCARVAAKSLL